MPLSLAHRSLECQAEPDFRNPARDCRAAAPCGSADPLFSSLDSRAGRHNNLENVGGGGMNDSEKSSSFFFNDY